MPRPPLKKRRQNSFTLKSPRKRRVVIPDQTQARQQHEKKLLQKPIGKRPDNSDDSDNIVTTDRTGRYRKRQEIYASGAVAKGDTPGAYPSKSQRTRTIREQTEEVLSQRSRSASRANSVASARSTPAAQSGSEKENASNKTATNAGSATSAKKRKLDEVNAKPNGVSNTPQAEVSVLGKIKPRKRQASILQLIENDNNDSTINTDDEAEFLPDEVSTPVNERQPAASSPQVSGSSSLKRKRVSGPPEPATTARSSSSLTPVPPQPTSNPFRLPQDQLPKPTRSQQKVLNKKQRDQDDIMAPPESSDDESDAEVPVQAQPSSSKKQRKPLAPSTEQLQDLMPSKKLKSRIRQQHQQQSEFEIPDDSPQEDVSEEENDHSAFLPSRSRKSQKRPQTKGKTNHTAKKQTGNGARTKTNINANTNTKMKEPSKSTRNTSYTPSPARLRTPRPLSSTTKSGTQAKSPSKQDTTTNTATGTSTAMREKSANTPLAAKSRNGKQKQQYGGSRLRGAGKENQVASLLDEASGGEMDVDTVGPQKNRNRNKAEQAATAEVKAWNKKWGDIDDFALEFEENTASTRSDSPMAR
ncbi:hypothetical protein OHC33_009987 [Knufia fluminis]|uniref:Uncharacterized protein n=1 Tax=Knufia fluminis TaxID=191047 RepID=A0AAN8EKG4_9EURO|nr:hypothetical protein OHC33_009987 [Knufia fluminis]